MKVLYVVAFILTIFGCNSESEYSHKGVIVQKYIIEPHEEEYRYSTVLMIGKVPVTQWHTGTRYIDTTYRIVYKKEYEITVGKETYYSANNGDTIKIK